MEAEFTTKSTFELFIHFVDAIIWPVTLLVILLIFRRNFSDAFKRLGTLKADSTGIELSFQSKIEATKKLFQQIKPALVSKSGQDIQTFTEENDMPFADILAARSNLINYLKITSEKEGINVDGLSPKKISDKLKETGGISIQQSKMINAMLEVTAAADASSTEQQAKDIEDLMQKIEIE